MVVSSMSRKMVRSNLVKVFCLGLTFLALPVVTPAFSEIPPPAAAVFTFEISSSNSSNSTEGIENFNQKVIKDGSASETLDSGHPTLHRILLNDIVNSDVEVAPGKKVELECIASSPVQWSYRGPGRPEFATKVVLDILNNREVHKALLTIRNAHDKDTGLYVCNYAEFPRIASAYHIFVPGSDIFVSESGRTITYSNLDPTVTIPCPVSVRSAKVTLRKSNVDGSLRNIDAPIAVFDPRLGFEINVKDLRDLDGTYICSGYHQGSLRIREYTVRNEERNQTSVTFPDNLSEDLNPCISFSCPKLSVCRVNLNTNRPFCACGPKASSSVSNCTRLCKSSFDCPKTEKCHFSLDKQLKMCVHVCDDHKCAENGECYVDEQKGVPKCRCRRGFQGDGDNNCERIPLIQDENSYCSAAKCGPHARCQNIAGKVRCVCYLGYFGSWPYCQKVCTQDSDCDILDRCSTTKAVCERVCTENMCAPNAECKVLHRKPHCLCPPGYAGNAMEACYPSHYYYSSRSGLPAGSGGTESDMNEVETTTGKVLFEEPIFEGRENESLKLSLPVSAEESNTQPSTSASIKFETR